MKKLFLLIAFLFITINIVSANQLKSEVNECFELTSIVFRLANAPEYVNNEISSYTNQIDNYFAKYKEHKLIIYLQEIREKYGISYDAVTNAAACLDIKGGSIIVKPDIDISKISVVDNRWSEEVFRVFVTQLNDFYRKTKFRFFYSQHKDIYEIAEKRMDNLLNSIDFNWFNTFFGGRVNKPLVVVSLINGPNNYAFTIPNKDKKFGIVIGCKSDSKGLPWFNENMIFIVMHELIHSYTTTIISSNWNQIDLSAQKIYSYVKEDMQKLAYRDAHTTISEWLTNLFTIAYINENPIKNLSIDYLIRQHHNNGFIWMKRSFLFMEHYHKNRNKYLSIDDYMSQIIGFINYTADNFNQVLNEYNRRQPYIVDIFPTSGSTIKLDMDTIEISFSEPMLSAHGLTPIDNESIITIPIVNKPFWKDEYTYIILLDKEKLEEDKIYGVKFNRNFFQSKKTYSMENDFIYTFNTFK